MIVNRKSRKYPSVQDAIDYLEPLGTLKFGGFEGSDTQIYTLEIVGKPYYILFIRRNGLVELYYEGRKPNT